MPVHLVADGEVVTDAVGVEDGEVAQRDATGIVGEPAARDSNAIVAARHHPQLADKRQHSQCHQVLWQLPQEEDGEQNGDGELT